MRQKLWSSIPTRDRKVSIHQWNHQSCITKGIYVCAEKPNLLVHYRVQNNKAIFLSAFVSKIVGRISMPCMACKCFLLEMSCFWTWALFDEYCAICSLFPIGNLVVTIFGMTGCKVICWFDACYVFVQIMLNVWYYVNTTIFWADSMGVTKLDNWRIRLFF